MHRLSALAIGALALAACSPSPGHVTAAPNGGATAGAAPDTPQWRPAVHLTPAKNWMNDPNGLVYSNGVYHVFYQYNPRGIGWGNISWGHATSSDLVHWDEKPVAISATDTEQIFSGSIVVDRNNTSGLGTADRPPLIALYTSAFGAGSGRDGVQAQSLAYSLDDGVTWTQDKNNPLLTLDPDSMSFRDPKVTWYEPGHYWIMTTVVADAHVVKFYKSTDLRHWDFLSDFSGVGSHDGLWEMPELIEMPVEDQPGQFRSVLLLSVNRGGIGGGSGVQYFVGRFDGTRFEAQGAAPQDAPAAAQQWLDYGADYYAATSISGAPGVRPVVIGWMSNWDYAADIPTSPWRGALAIPRELWLTASGDRYLVHSAIAETAARELRQEPSTEVHLSPHDERLSAPQATDGPTQLLDVVIEPNDAVTAGLVLRASASGSTGTTISYDVGSEVLALDRTRSGITGFSSKFSLRHEAKVPMQDGRLQLTILVDNGSVELFAQDGRAVLTDIIFPPRGDDALFAFANSGQADVRLTVRNIPGTDERPAGT